MDRKEIYRIKILSLKETFKNYPYLLSLMLIVCLITGSFVGLVWILDEKLHVTAIAVTAFSYQFAYFDRNEIPKLLDLITKVGTIFFVFKSLVANVIIYGIKNACVNLDKNFSIFIGFKKNYWKIMLTLLIKSVLVGIGSLFFLIPGLILNFQWYFVDYLLYDKPELSIKEIFAESARYTATSKFALFRFEFSYFYLYAIAYFLNQLTFGLSNSLVQPIVYNARAKVYLEFKRLYQ